MHTGDENCEPITLDEVERLRKEDAEKAHLREEMAKAEAHNDADNDIYEDSVEAYHEKQKSMHMVQKYDGYGNNDYDEDDPDAMISNESRPRLLGIDHTVTKRNIPFEMLRSPDRDFQSLKLIRREKVPVRVGGEPLSNARTGSTKAIAMSE